MGQSVKYSLYKPKDLNLNCRTPYCQVQEIMSTHDSKEIRTAEKGKYQEECGSASLPNPDLKSKDTLN